MLMKLQLLSTKDGGIFVDSELPLFLAVKNGHLEVVKLLAAEGSPAARYTTFYAVLAAGKGHQRVVDYLEHI